MPKTWPLAPKAKTNDRNTIVCFILSHFQEINGDDSIDINGATQYPKSHRRYHIEFLGSAVSRLLPMP